MSIQKYETLLKDFIKQKFDKNNVLGIALILALLIAFSLIIEEFGENEYFIILFIVLVLLTLYLLNFFGSKKGKVKTLILKSIDALKRNNYTKSFDYLLNAYEIIKDKLLLEIMNNFAYDFSISPLQKATLTQIQIKEEKKDKKNDENYRKLLEQLEQISAYIIKHNASIEESSKKIKSLEDKLTNINDETMQREYQKLIERYKNIVKLESSKIAFYSKAQNQLYDLKKKHLLNKELIMEKEKLRNFEDSILEKSIAESYKKGSVDEFILYETEYLKALGEYSETLSVSADENIFDELIRDFETKVKSIEL